MNPTTQNQSIDLRERQRRERNKHRVNNPFTQDRYVVWDGFSHLVPANGFAILEEFLTNKYLTETALWVINQKASNAITEENARRKTNNQLPMDRTRKTGEQLEFETPFYVDGGLYTQNEQILQQAQNIATDRDRMIFIIVKEYNLYGGLVEEFGMYQPLQQPKDSNQISVSITESLNSPAMSTGPTVIRHEGGSLDGINDNPTVSSTSNSITDELQAKDVFTLRKLAREKGIETEKTDKKADLIAKLT